MNQTSDAAAIFRPIWRGKWLILAVGIVVAAGSYVYYKRAAKIYSNSTAVFLGSGEERVPGEKAPAKSSGTTGTSQAQIINSFVIEEVRLELKKEHKGAIAKGKVKAKSPEKSPLISISSEAPTAKSAASLVNAVAQAYIKRSENQRRNSINRAIALNRRQLRRIEAANPPAGSSSAGKTSAKSILQATNLVTKINSLEQEQLVIGAQQIKPAKARQSVLVAPNPRKDAIFGFVIGIVLGAIAVYALSRFNRQVRSLADAEALFPTHILAALPKVKRPIVAVDGQPRPSRLLLEPLSRLHTTLQLGETLNGSEGARRRVVLFISADAGDGKSTLAADLALVQREAGQRVALVEANFRRPVQARLLGLDGAPHGLAAVLGGSLALDEAMEPLPMQPAMFADPGEAHTGVATAVESRAAGALFLLAGGGSVVNPAAVLADERMAGLLGSLAEDFDYVLIDAPSPLEFSDAMPLLRLVDGVVIVARVGHTRETSAQRLVQLLAQVSSTPLLGTVVNCVAPKDIERYGFSTSSGRGRSAKLLRR
jgi:Mrp family chromosome partitioning ATPase/capsular polysaccharide biosynthesis protein